MKKIVKILVICLVFACVLVCGCDVSGFVKKSDEQKAFEKYFANVQKLYEVSLDYSNRSVSATLDPLVRTFAYLRCGNPDYNASTWKLLAGSVEADFEEFIQQSSYSLQILGDKVNNIDGLRDIDTIIVPKTNRKIDAFHMFATMNVVYKNIDANGKISQQPADLAGWGGDLCQLAQQLKGKNLTPENLQSTADNLLNASEGSTFGDADLNGDIDAYNIAFTITQSSDIDLAKIFVDYYKKDLATMKSNFYDNCINVDNDLTGDIETDSVKVVNRLKGNFSIVLWCSGKVDFNTDSAIFTACAKTFLNYFK